MSKEKELIKQAQISDLPYPECVRARKGMYISNLNQMVTEIVDNSVDEHFAGFCNVIAVTVKSDGSIIVQDAGRGIPVAPHKTQKNKSQVEAAFTTLHSGGKFGTDDKDGYAAKTGGTHGVGGAAVNALSEYMNIYINCYGESHEINFEKGVTINKCRKIGTYEEEHLRGTTVEFLPDATLWEDGDPLNTKKLAKRLKQMSYLNPNLMFYVNIEADSLEESYLSENGLQDYIEELTKSKKKIIEPIYTNKSKNDIDVQLSLCYVDSYNNELYTFVNNMETIDKGDHLTGFQMGLADALKEYCENYNIKLDYKSEDLKEGLVAIISVRVADANFEGQAKTKLKMNSVRNAVREISKESILEYFDKNPASVKLLIAKIEQATKAREAASLARERSRTNKEISGTAGKAEKLSDCSSKIPSECEIYMVEGDSAAGSAKQGRNRKTQAILPVFGKIQNVEKMRDSLVYSNQKIGEINKATKVQIGADCNPETSRYHKIIIMTDADVDGAHIRTLYLTYFYRYQRPLIEAGMIYLACPPLFKITLKDKSIHYVYSKESLTEFEATHNDIVNVQRFKGLGEMNADQLWDTTMNPETRTLIRVTVDDAEEAEGYLSLCMGKEVAPRKAWVMQNAIYAEEEM